MKQISIALAGLVLVSLLLGACGSYAHSRANRQPRRRVTHRRAGPYRRIRDVAAAYRHRRQEQPDHRRRALPLSRNQRTSGRPGGRQAAGWRLCFAGGPDLGAKDDLAPDAGPEQIAPLEPDVVLLRSFMADSLGRPLEELGIPVVYLDLETPEQYFRDVAVLGQMMGDPVRAETIKDYYQSRLDSVQQAVAALGDDQKPRVLLVQYSEQGGEVALNVPSASLAPDDGG